MLSKSGIPILFILIVFMIASLLSYSPTQLAPQYFNFKVIETTYFQVP
jgi:hypothetical protein